MAEAVVLPQGVGAGRATVITSVDVRLAQHPGWEGPGRRSSQGKQCPPWPWIQEEQAPEKPEGPGHGGLMRAEDVLWTIGKGAQGLG